jgi:transcriptional regulator with XRE-family HTH domain
MALFFDTGWFDAKLSALHLTRSDLARALGLSESQIAEVFKDQRELSGPDVSLIASLLAVSTEEVANHAGVSTPVPKKESTNVDAALKEITARLDRIEQAIAELKARAGTKS